VVFKKGSRRGAKVEYEYLDATLMNRIGLAENDAKKTVTAADIMIFMK